MRRACGIVLTVAALAWVGVGCAERVTDGFTTDGTGTDGTGSEEVSSTPDGADGEDTGTVADGAGGEDAGPQDAGPDAGGDASGEGVVVIPPVAGQCTSDGECSGDDKCRSGVCVADPPASSVAHITDPEDNKATSDPPNLTCIDQVGTTPEGPESTTLYGAVTRFGSGRLTFNVQVDIFLAADWDPSACEEEDDLEDRAACYDAYGDPIGSTKTLQPEALVGSSECNVDNVHDDCPLGYECIGDETSAECKVQFGLYRIDDIPTNTPLVIRAHFVGDELFADLWHDVYHFGVYLHADRVEEGGLFRYDATMVSDGQWKLTPDTVGLAEVPPDRGVVGGRVRDCHVEGERLSWPVGEARLDLARSAERVVYFNDLETDTVPLQDRVTTNILGRFAALNLEAGWSLLGGSVRVGGEVVSLGSERVYVVPDALSVVSFPGHQPLWKQEPVGDFPQ